jgi:hypothetical protein
MQNDASARNPLILAPGVKSAPAPLIKSATIRRSYKLGPHRAALLGRVESTSLTDYLYVLAVFWEQATEPCLIVTSEVNAQCWNIGGGSHFLGVSYADVHRNLGASDDWADVEKFTSKALSIAATELGVKETPREVSGESDVGDSSLTELTTKGVSRT